MAIFNHAFGNKRSSNTAQVIPHPLIYIYVFPTPLLESIRIVTPTKLETNEAATIPNLDNSTLCMSGKDKPEIKIDIVNPIPPKTLAPSMWPQFIPPIKFILKIFTVAKVKKKSPEAYQPKDLK